MGVVPDAKNIYVDNVNGDNARSGRKSYLAGGDGPKASLKEAWAAAQNGDTIVILSGNGTYGESDWAGADKNLIILPIGEITIGRKETKQ